MTMIPHNFEINISRRGPAGSHTSDNGTPLAKHYGRLELGQVSKEIALQTFADLCVRFPDHNLRLIEVECYGSDIAEQSEDPE